LVQPLKHAIPRVVADIVRRAPLSPSKIEFAWGMAVGPSVQRNTTIRLEGTQLVVESSTRQWADEVRRSSRVILARLRTMLGEATVSRLEIRSR
jgi:Dna[CI] antecedent, DciA